MTIRVDLISLISLKWPVRAAISDQCGTVYAGVGHFVVHHICSSANTDPAAPFPISAHNTPSWASNTGDGTWVEGISGIGTLAHLHVSDRTTGTISLSHVHPGSWTVLASEGTVIPKLLWISANASFLSASDRSSWAILAGVGNLVHYGRVDAVTSISCYGGISWAGDAGPGCSVIGGALVADAACQRDVDMVTSGASLTDA